MEESELESAGFLEKFGRMQTLDQDDSVSQMLRLIGDDKLNGEQARFYLEMNMWNVQAAVCSYFDLEPGNSSRLPSMTFLQDVTIGEGESVPPSAAFVKTWKVRNSGTDNWPPGVSLRFAFGTKLCDVDSVPVKALNPSETTDVSVGMVAPSNPGIYESKWRMCTSSGNFFGDPIFVIISVEIGGTLALTQQMNDFSELGRHPGFQNHNNNPFAPLGTAQNQEDHNMDQ